jgi:hypothetical protein
MPMFLHLHAVVWSFRSSLVRGVPGQTRDGKAQIVIENNNTAQDTAAQKQKKNCRFWLAMAVPREATVSRVHSK